jgi:hypothetical protein
MKAAQQLAFGSCKNHFLCQMTAATAHFPWSSLLICTCGDQLLKQCLRLQEPPSKSIQSDNSDNLKIIIMAKNASLNFSIIKLSWIPSGSPSPRKRRHHQFSLLFHIPNIPNISILVMSK